MRRIESAKRNCGAVSSKRGNPFLGFLYHNFPTKLLQNSPLNCIIRMMNGQKLKRSSDSQSGTVKEELGNSTFTQDHY